MKKISVVGSGTMGNGIAHVFAQNGFEVSLIDVSPETLKKALNTIEKNLDRQVAKEAITEAIKKSALANISTFTDIPSGVKDAELVVEAATENVDLKLKIFKELDASSPAGAILASNTSSISITSFSVVIT